MKKVILSIFITYSIVCSLKSMDSKISLDLWPIILNGLLTEVKTLPNLRKMIKEMKQCSLTCKKFNEIVKNLIAQNKVKSLKELFEKRKNKIIQEIKARLLDNRFENETYNWFNDLDAQNNDGWTALINAVFYQREDIIKLLLENGANINIKDNTGWDALQYAIQGQNKDIINLLNQYNNTKPQNNTNHNNSNNNNNNNDDGYYNKDFIGKYECIIQ